MGRYRAADLKTPPNLISLLRLGLAFLFPFCSSTPAAALALLLLAGLTDVLDGWWARRFACATPLGAVLDPVADKLFVASVVLTLIIRGLLPFPLALLLATRELLELPLVIWWLLNRRQRTKRAENPQANWLGKVTTVAQFAAIATALLAPEYVTQMLLLAGSCGAASAALYWKRAQLAN